MRKIFYIENKKKENRTGLQLPPWILYRQDDVPFYGPRHPVATLFWKRPRQEAIYKHSFGRLTILYRTKEEVQYERRKNWFKN